MQKMFRYVGVVIVRMCCQSVSDRDDSGRIRAWARHSVEWQPISARDA